MTPANTTEKKLISFTQYHMPNGAGLDFPFVPVQPSTKYMIVPEEHSSGGFGAVFRTLKKVEGMDGSSHCALKVWGYPKEIEKVLNDYYNLPRAHRQEISEIRREFALEQRVVGFREKSAAARLGRGRYPEFTRPDEDTEIVFVHADQGPYQGCIFPAIEMTWLQDCEPLIAWLASEGGMDRHLGPQVFDRLLKIMIPFSGEYVHNDLTPMNIVVTGNPHRENDFFDIRIIDFFSLYKIVKNVPITEDRMVWGTSGWSLDNNCIAHENPKRDIYALGNILQAMLCGFEGSGPGDCSGEDERRQRLAKAIPGVPDALIDLVADMTSTDLNRRPSLNEVKNQLSGCSWVKCHPSDPNADGRASKEKTHGSIVMPDNQKVRLMLSIALLVMASVLFLLVPGRPDIDNGGGNGPERINLVGEILIDPEAHEAQKRFEGLIKSANDALKEDNLALAAQEARRALRMQIEDRGGNDEAREILRQVKSRMENLWGNRDPRLEGIARQTMEKLDNGDDPGEDEDMRLLAQAMHYRGLALYYIMHHPAEAVEQWRRLFRRFGNDKDQQIAYWANEARIALNEAAAMAVDLND